MTLRDSIIREVSHKLKDVSLINLYFSLDVSAAFIVTMARRDIYRRLTSCNPSDMVFVGMSFSEEFGITKYV